MAWQDVNGGRSLEMPTCTGGGVGPRYARGPQVRPRDSGRSCFRLGEIEPQHQTAVAGVRLPPRSHCKEVGVWNRPNRSLLAVRGAAVLCHNKCGGPTWIRTKNQVVMSHLLYR